MQYAKTIMPYGMDGKEIIVEVASNRSLPTIDIIGLPDSAIRESKERLRATFRECNIDIPPRKYVINLAPSDVRKSGTMLDVAIGVGLLLAIYDWYVHCDVSDMLWFGELWLDGSIKWIQNIFAWVMAGIQYWYTKFVVPAEVAREVSYITNVTIYTVSHFREVIEFVLHGKLLLLVEHKNIAHTIQQLDWFNHIQWHVYAKRALAIAACGMHHILMVWPPWSWKSMLAKWLRSILLPMSTQDIMEVSHIHSLVGWLSHHSPIITQRPFRMVHSTTSKIAVVGGGQNILPGELSLAHKGILFFDEIGEFSRDILDTLRQPLEDKYITLTRAKWSITYPSQCMFVCAMNPCPCGYYGDGEKPCICSINAVKKYQSKISGPLLDRMDMILTIGRENGIEENIKWTVNKNLTESKDEMKMIKDNLLYAQSMQQKRYAESIYTTNSDVLAHDIVTYMPLDKECKALLDIATKKLSLSLRVVHKTIRLARSIADFSGADNIRKEDILEALQYRSEWWLVKE